MNTTDDRLLAWAQIGLSILFIIFTFIVIVIYEIGGAHFASTDQEKSFGSTLNWLTGACLIIIYFWFQRQRAGGIPDSSQMVTQTNTAPDGTKTVITSPKGAQSVPTFATKVMNVPTLKDSISK